MRTDVAIIGGGLAGLSCAIGLGESGLQVEVLERGDRPGGRARSWRDEATGDLVDLGPHIIHSHYRNFLKLLETLGTAGQMVWRTDKFITLLSARERLALRMHPWLTPPLHLLPVMLAAKSVALRDKLSNLRFTWLAMRLREEDLLAFDAVDAVDAAELLAAYGVTPAFRDWFWASTAMAILNLPLAECSAGALLRFYRQMIGHNDVRVGFSAQGLGNLFVDAAARRIAESGGRIRLDCEALYVEPRADGVQLRLAGGESLHARFCVIATEPQAWPRLLPEGGLPLAPPPSPYISTWLWFAQKLTRESLWSRVWSPGNLNYDFYDFSNIRPGLAGKGSLIAANIIHSQRAAHLGDAEIVAATLAELAAFAPGARTARLLHQRVHRIPMAIPCPHPGSEARRPSAATRFANLFLAGDWTATALPASMESAVRSGFLAAEALWAALGRPRKLAEDVEEPRGLTGWLRRRAGAAPFVPPPTLVRR